ncbi:hypothetical protein ACFLZM_01250 [Thermodesulfobacteriota bacterium]
MLDTFRRNIPVKRFGKTIKTANAILFLARDKSSYIAGVTPDVNFLRFPYLRVTFDG